MRITLTTTLLAAALLGAAGCDTQQNLEAFGDIQIITHSTGTPDPDGYVLHVTGRDSVAMADNDTVTYTHLAIGDYTVALTGVYPGCVVAGGASQSVYVPVGVKKFELDVNCP